MKINLEIIFNVLIGLFLYNMILKAFANVLIKSILNSKPGQEIKKDFNQKLAEKLKENDEKQH